MEFHVGERVVCIQDFPDDNQNITIGLTGVVKNIHGLRRIGVAWDENVHGHNLNGETKYGYGWWVNADCIAPYTEEVSDEEVGEVSLDGLFS